MRLGSAGDFHFPFCHSMYLDFLEDTFEKWHVDRVHCAGDVVDHHGISAWEHNPNGMSAGYEFDAAKQDVEAAQSRFPNMTVCIGNHDERHFRLARKHGMPDNYLKSYADLWNTPGWKWDFQHTCDGVLYEHGTGSSGKDAALNLAIQKRTSVVIGHVHSWGGVKWHANPYDLVFGLNCGCGIDCSAYAFEYGKAFAVRPVLGCGIVIDGEQAHFEIMRCDVGEKYHRSKAGRHRRLKRLVRSTFAKVKRKAA